MPVTPFPPSRTVPAVLAQPGAESVSVSRTVSIPTDPAAPIDSDSASPLDQQEESARQQRAQDFIHLALERWKGIDSYESAWRKAARTDLDFFAGNQWPEPIRKQREDDKRPCLTINRLPGFVRQVSNEIAQAGQGIEVEAVDNGADPELADVLMGTIQHIESNSSADVAYDTATAAQARVGKGWFRIVPEYADDNSFEQELRIKRIRNPFTVYADPSYQELDGSDMGYLFIVEDIPTDEYDARFGKESRASLEQFARVGEQAAGWLPKGRVRVAEYYTFEPVNRTIVRLSNGAVYDSEALKNEAVLTQLVAQGVSPEPVATRIVRGKQLTWALINGAQVLDGNDDKTAGRPMPGRYIPVFVVPGEEIDLDGVVDYKGVVRDAVSSQQQANYHKSSMTETVALMPKSPYVAEAGQIEDREDEWGQANVKAFSVLTYKARTLDGNLIPPPQRNVMEAPIQAMAALSMQAENDLRATAGFSYDVGSHETQPERSGKAILARQRQGEIGNSHFQKHLAVALRHAGRVLLDLIPHYYDVPRIKRITGRDGTAQTVILHAGNADAAKQLAAQEDIPIEKIYDVSMGRYDVRVRAGASFASQRAADRDLMTSTIQAAPQLIPVMGDLYFRSMDSPVAQQISKRLKKALPPALQDDGENGKQAEIPPAFLQQAQQAQQLIDALTQRVHELTDAAITKKLELESRERIAQIQANAMISVAEGKATTTQQLAVLEAAMRRIETLVDLDVARIEAGHAINMGAVDHARQSALQQSSGAADASAPGQPPGTADEAVPPAAPPSSTPSPVGSAGILAGQPPAPAGA